MKVTPKYLAPERFTLRMFQGKYGEAFKSKFKEDFKILPKAKEDFTDIYQGGLSFLISGCKTKRYAYALDDIAIDFFRLTFEMGPRLRVYEIQSRQAPEWVLHFNSRYKELETIYRKEDAKLYWKKRKVSKKYKDEDIVITDPCYLGDFKGECICDLVADTIYGDWGCTCFDESTHKVLGKFCADGGQVCVVPLNRVLEHNPAFKEWADVHSWCVCIIKNFTGTVSIKYDIEHFEYKGKPCKELYCYVEGKGSTDFTTRQTSL